jgi:hypothetical protein
MENIAIIRIYPQGANQTQSMDRAPQDAIDELMRLLL